MKTLLWILAGFFSSFLVAMTGYGLFTIGGIGAIIILPIIGFVDYLLLKKLNVL
jgi:preprotein translocase subunit Sss1